MNTLLTSRLRSFGTLGLLMVFFFLAAGTDGARAATPPVQIRTGISMSWPSVVGKTYRAQWAENPSGPWTDLVPPMAGTGATLTCFDPFGRYRRVVDTTGASVSAVLQSAIKLTWPSAVGARYQLQTVLDLKSNAWTDNGPMVAGDGALQEIIAPRSTSYAYYRLRIPPFTNDTNPNWRLVWEDDFSKSNGQLDLTKWNIAINGNGNGNQELQYYTNSPANLKIENGMLAITAIKENKEWAGYTSAKITTSGKFSLKYGRIEACIKSPKAQQGNWPAFWMMPQNSVYGGWPRSGEIDIMEMVNDCRTLYSTLHYGNPHTYITKSTTLANGDDFTKDFHVYAVEWEPTVFRWYVDGRLYATQTNTWFTRNGNTGDLTKPYPAPFDQNFYLILNFAVGGQWPGSPNAASVFPQTMYVKYVRVYQP